MTEEIQKAARQKPGPKPRAAPIEQEIMIDDGPEESAAARTQTRSAARTNASGRIEVSGRDGEVLSRTRTHVGDIFEIPGDMIPPGWDYQWNSVSIAGNSDIILDQNHMMHQNGWRPVPASRYQGTLVPKGATGSIIRGQQMLMERPLILSQEARAEDLRNAEALINDRNESLKLTKVKSQLPEGLEMSRKYRGSGGGMKMAIDKSLDVLNVNREAGNYQTDE
jgi:hypothetical protein